MGAVNFSISVRFQPGALQKESRAITWQHHAALGTAAYAIVHSLLGRAERRRALTWRRHFVARAQTMWKEWRQDLMWHPSVAPLRLQALHLIMRPRRTASSTFSRPADSLTHTCAVRRLVSHQHAV